MPSLKVTAISDEIRSEAKLFKFVEENERVFLTGRGGDTTEVDEDSKSIISDEEAFESLKSSYVPSRKSSSVQSISSRGDNSSTAHSYTLSIPLSRKLIQAIATKDQTFPELIEAFRRSAKESKDPAFRMTFIDYLFVCADKIMDEPESLGIFFDVEDERTPFQRQKAMRDTLIQDAMKWLKRLATHGSCPYPDAQFFLAELYGRGEHGLKVNHGKAFALYFAASKQGHPASTYRVAVCYEMGAGTKKDAARAIQFYRKSAAAGDPLAMHKYALMLLYGHLGMKRGIKEGISWLKRASAVATIDCPHSLMDLARLFEKDSGCPMIIPDEGYALELYIKAARLGHAPAQYRLGTCHEFGLLQCPLEPRTALRWYAKAADQGYAEAQLALSHWYLTGLPAPALEDLEHLEENIVIKPSEVDAYEWARRAAEQSLPKAQYTVGYYHEEGIGCEADLGAALMWYRRSAEQNYHRALKRLAELKVPFKAKSSRCIIQ
ncbi:hypothetical protein C9890_0622 [Perkinsus sp. BL_2016]|nr:hypothetical protein C9890_0622 [Perkinsus sp. BL_2016]